MSVLLKNAFSTLSRLSPAVTNTAKHALPLTYLNEDEQAICDLVSRLAKDKIQPFVKEMDAQSKMNPSVIQALFDNGLMALEADSKYGGTEANFFSSILVIEELAKVDPSVSALVCINNTLVFSNLKKFANEELKNKYIPMMVKDKVGSFCISEAGSGSDAFALQTRAEKKGEYYLLNGTKSWITNAGDASFYIVYANAAPSQGYKGISAFIVDRDTPGLTIASPEDKLGIRASSTCSVILEDVKVPESQIMGKIGDGYKYAIQTLNEGRIGIGAQMLGLAEGVFEHAVKYTLERKQFGKAIFDFQGMQHQIARIAMEIEAAKLLVYNAARMTDLKVPVIKEAAMAKLAASEVAANASSKAVEWLGGVGFTKDFPVEKYYRDAKIGQIYEGTSNIQLNTIAKIIQSQFK